jgi:hypothetical protein
MALANLNINVNANIGDAVRAMREVKSTTSDAMAQAQKSVDTFQQGFEQSATAVNSAARSMGLETSKSTNQISTDMQEATKKVEEFAASRVAIAAVGIALGAVAATAATVGYAAYKASGFIAGLITGESYKSKNIDALIAMDKEVRALQSDLQLTAMDANALNDALQRLGVNKSDITDVYGKVEGKIKGGNTAELDRLGVEWKGKTPEEVIGNAVKVLDQYTEGWDRNQAAIAMGLGTHAQMANYLKVNQTELQKSKDRLNEYNLGIGPETQKYVDQYQTAMLEFKNETRLMGEATKRVWADQVMPAFTDLSTHLKDGWPSIVNGVRHVVAAFTSLGYGLKMSFDMVYDTLEGIFKATGGGFAAVAAAIEQAMRGNFTQARQVLIDGWNDTKKSISGITDEIAKDAQKNLNAMKLAQGQFNSDTSKAGTPGSNKKGSKFWVPAPTAEEIDEEQKKAEVAYNRYSAFFDSTKNKIFSLDPTHTDLDKKIASITTETLKLSSELPDYAKSINDISAEYIDAEKRAFSFKSEMQGINAEIKELETITSDMAGFKNLSLEPKGGFLGFKVKGPNKLSLTGGSTSGGWSDLTNSDDRQYKEIESARAQHNATMLAMQYDYVSQSIGLSRQAFSDNKALSLLMLAAEAAVNISRIIQMSEVEITAARMWAQISGGPAGMAMASMQEAAIRARMPLQIAMVIGSTAIEGLQIAGKRASGGPVLSGKSYLGGEKGPELFTPGASGAITPNDQLGGGVVLNQSFTITGVAADLMQNMKAIAKQAGEQAKSEILNNLNRGGSFARATGRA